MSSREKKLLMIVAVGLVLVLGYFFIYNPIIDTTEEYKTQIGTYESELIQLRAQYDSRERYLEETENYLLLIEEVKEQMPPDLQQERLFELLFVIEEEFPDVQFETISFGELELLSNSKEEMDENTFSAVRRNVSTSADFTYSELKDFLKLIYDYEDKTVLSNLNMVLNEETGFINVTISLNMYGLLGGDRIPEDIEFDEVEYGTDIIFGSPNIDWDELGLTIEDQPSDLQADLFISLKPIDSDGFTHVIGKVIDSGERSYIKHESNSALNGILRIFSEGDQYFANYEIDGVSLDRQEFDVETALEMDVFSSSRNDSDNVSLNLNIYNQTDVTLFIDVKSDDGSRPRFNPTINQGDVVIN